MVMASVERSKFVTGTICLVCEDTATGNHYSVPSCNGCKTFFRRAIVNKRNFTCEAQGNCSVNKGIRCACRACRLAKCLAVGMDPKAIQGARDRIGYTKRTRKHTPSTAATAAALDEEETRELSPMPGPSSATIDDYGVLATEGEAGLDDENTTFGFRATSNEIPILEVMPPIESTASSRYSAMLERLTQLERSFSMLMSHSASVAYTTLEDALDAPSCFLKPARSATMDRQLQLQRTISAEKQSETQLWQAHMITLYVDWAKTFSVFRKLPKSDKIALLKNNVGSFIIMYEAFRASESRVSIKLPTKKSSLQMSWRQVVPAGVKLSSIHKTVCVERFHSSQAFSSSLGAPGIVRSFTREPSEPRPSPPNRPSFSSGMSHLSPGTSSHSSEYSSRRGSLDSTVWVADRSSSMARQMSGDAAARSGVAHNSPMLRDTSAKSPSLPVKPMKFVLSLTELAPITKVIEDYIAKPFDNLALSTTEFATLHAILFFDPEAENLDAASQRNVAVEQKKFINALFEFIFSNYPAGEVCARFSAIILRSTIIRKAERKKKESLKLMDIFNVLTLDDLVKETALGMTSASATISQAEANPASAAASISSSGSVLSME